MPKYLFEYCGEQEIDAESEFEALVLAAHPCEIDNCRVVSNDFGEAEKAGAQKLQ